MALQFGIYYTPNKDGTPSINLQSFEKLDSQCKKTLNDNKTGIWQLGIVIDSDPESGLVSILSLQELFFSLNSSQQFVLKPSMKKADLSTKINYLYQLKEQNDPVFVDEHRVVRTYYLGAEGLGLQISSLLFFNISQDEYFSEYPVFNIVSANYILDNYKSCQWLYKMISCLSI